jgi:tetratricopeptide (TPR) repeat protein
MALDPRSVPALTSVAKAYLDMANLAQALLYYEQLLVLEKNLTDHHLMVARIKLDVRDPELHDPQSALRHANMALDACNSLQEGACDMPAVFEVLAIAWGTLGNFDEARGAAEKSMELYRVKLLPAQVDKMKNMIEYFEKQQ